MVVSKPAGVAGRLHAALTAVIRRLAIAAFAFAARRGRTVLPTRDAEEQDTVDDAGCRHGRSPICSVAERCVLRVGVVEMRLQVTADAVVVRSWDARLC